MKKLLLILIIAFGLNSANAQSPWITNGPAGKVVSHIIATDTSVIASTYNGGIFFSDNNGGTWTMRNNGLGDTIVKFVAVSDTTIYAATADSGVFISTNKGANWRKADSGITYPNMAALAVMDTDVFAGSAGGGVFLSTNKGATWRKINNGLSDTDIFALLVSGTNIFAGTHSGGIFLSADRGASWTTVNTGLTNTSILSLATDGSTIFAGTSGGGAFVSNNNGSTWTPLALGSRARVYSFGVGASAIFASTDSSLFLSYNHGSSWASVIGLADSEGVNALAVNSTTVFAGMLGIGVWQQSLNNVTTGLQETKPVAETEFNLYPNPAQNSFTIKTNGNEKQLLQVFDIAGKLVLSQPLYNNSTSIDASCLSNGIYCISLINNGAVTSEKLVIVK